MRRRIAIISCSSIVGLILVLLAIFTALANDPNDPTTQPINPSLEPINIALYPQPTTFVIYIGGDTPYYLNDFDLRVMINGQFSTYPITTNFVPFTSTQGVATPGACYMFGQADTQPDDFPSFCLNENLQFYTRHENFWWDTNAGQRRTIAIGHQDQPASRICVAWQPACTFNINPTPYDGPPATRTVAPTQTADAPVVIAPTVTLITVLPSPTTFNNSSWSPVSLTVNGVEFVMVPAGCFTMGSTQDQINSVLNLCSPSDPVCNAGAYSDETPAHLQCFDNPYWITRYEITNGEFGGFGRFSGNTRPREIVSYDMASGFCERRGWRLPTEAEWEYAARGPNNLIFTWGNTFDPLQVVYESNSGGRTVDVTNTAIRNESWVGAYHMAGNVWEWTSSIYRPYPFDTGDGRENPGDTLSERVVRGGSFTSSALDQRTTQRLNWALDSRDSAIGFRCIRPYSDDDIPGQ